MSPPNIYHCAKPTAVVSDGEMLLEKRGESDVASVVKVETKGAGKCCTLSNRRCRILLVCCVTFLAVLAATSALLLGVIFGRRAHKSWSCLYGEDRITENFWVEEDFQLIHATHAHGSHEEPSMHVLQDYHNGVAAYKDTERNICYITFLTETFHEGLYRWHSYERTGRDAFTLQLTSDRSADPEELRTASVHIYLHCVFAHSQSFFADEIKEIDVTSTMIIVKV